MLQWTLVRAPSFFLTCNTGGDFSMIPRVANSAAETHGSQLLALGPFRQTTSPRGTV